MIVDPTMSHLLQCFFHHLQSFFRARTLPVPEKKGEGHAAWEFGGLPQSSINWIELTLKSIKSLRQNFIAHGVLRRIKFSHLMEGIFQLRLHLLHFPSMGMIIIGDHRQNFRKTRQSPSIFRGEIGSRMKGDEVRS